MNKFIRFVFIIFYLMSTAVIYLSTVDKYDIIYDMDPMIHQGSLIHNSNDEKVLSGFLLALIFISQIAFFYFEKSKRWKWVTGIMAGIACLFFFIR